MSKIFFLRHCKTLFNIQEIICGSMDISIYNDAHIKGGDELYDCLDSMNIYCSPLARCKETLYLLKDIWNYPLNIIDYNKLIVERHMGRLEGMSRDDAINNFPAFFYNKKFIYQLTPPDGETYNDFYYRIVDFYRQVDTDKNILICAHNQVLKILYSLFTQQNIESFWYSKQFEPGCIHVIKNT